MSAITLAEAEALAAGARSLEPTFDRFMIVRDCNTRRGAAHIILDAVRDGDSVSDFCIGWALRTLGDLS